MKAMSLVILVGVIFAGVMIGLGVYSFDDTVEKKAYRAALKYDSNKAVVKEMTKGLSELTVVLTDNSASFFIKGLERDITEKPVEIMEARLNKPVGGGEIVLKKTADGFYYDGLLKPGWYRLALNCVKGNDSAVVSKSVYIN